MIEDNSFTLEELHPTYQLFARSIGVENALKLANEIGGDPIYLPRLFNNKVPFFEARNRRIIEGLKSSGANLEELHPTYQQLAQIIGIENVLKLAYDIGGEQFHLPKTCRNMSPLIEARDRQIIEDLKTSGATVPSMARKYKLTQWHVYAIVRRAKKTTLEGVKGS